MTDVRRSEEDKEAETETEANEGRWHSARLEVGHFPIIFLHIWPLFFRDFISSIALYKPEENGDEKKKEKEEKKVEKPEKKQVTLIVSEGKSAFILLLPATPVHRAGSDDSVELFQDWLSRGHNQQNPTEWIGHPTLPKVETKITVDRFQLVFV